MYKVTLDISRLQVVVECNTLAAIREVATAKIEKFSVVSVVNDDYGQYQYKHGSLLKSEPEFLSTEAHPIPVGPSIVWQDVEQFVDHALHTHANKLAKSNLLPLTSKVRYLIVDQKKRVRDACLLEVHQTLVSMGVLKALN